MSFRPADYPCPGCNRHGLRWLRLSRFTVPQTLHCEACGWKGSRTDAVNRRAA